MTQSTPRLRAVTSPRQQQLIAQQQQQQLLQGGQSNDHTTARKHTTDRQSQHQQKDSQAYIPMDQLHNVRSQMSQLNESMQQSLLGDQGSGANKSPNESSSGEQQPLIGNSHLHSARSEFHHSSGAHPHSHQALHHQHQNDVLSHSSAAMSHLGQPSTVMLDDASGGSSGPMNQTSPSSSSAHLSGGNHMHHSSTLAVSYGENPTSHLLHSLDVLQLSGEPETPAGKVQIDKFGKAVVFGSASLAACVAPLTSTLLGAGILGLPHAIASAGYALGLLFLVFSACTSALGLHLLSCCAHTVGITPSSFYVIAKTAVPRSTALIDLAVAIKVSSTPENAIVKFWINCGT